MGVMTIRAIVHNGLIQPLEPLPAEWAEGKELVVEESAAATAEDLQAWARELDEEINRIPPEEHDRFRLALDEVERESKDAVRREWGLP
jgi:NifB/MoaA-like Fe-S oxidoreductase